EGTLKVTDRKEAYDITVKAKSDSATYDGKEHSVSGFKTTKFTVEGHEYTVEGLSASAKGTNAGTYASKVEGTAKVLDAAGNDVTKQFSINTIDGKLTINKKALEITVTGNSATKTYTGKEQSVEGFSTSTLPENVKVDLAAGKTAKAAGTNAGTYDMKLTKEDLVVSGADNYDVTLKVVDGKLTINKKALEITVTGNSIEKPYSGEEQSVEGYKTSELPSGVSIDLASGSNAKATGKNVGTYNMNLAKKDFVVSGADNYDVTLKVVDGKLTINKAKLAATVTGNNDSKVFNNTEQSVEGYKVTGLPADLEGVSISLKVERQAIAKGTEVGTYNMDLTKNDFEATGENAKNYDVDITVVDGYLVITPVPYVPPVVQDTTYNVVANYYTSKDQGKTYTQDNTSTVEVKTATTVKVGDALTVTPEDAWAMYDGNKYFIDAEKSEMTKTAVLDAASNTLTLNYYRNTGSDDNNGDNNNKDDGDNNNNGGNGGNGGNGSSSDNPSNNNSAGPDTGDSNDLGFWAGICGASGVLLAGLYFGMRRRENSDSESEN
ncbi:MBG domain-containing protein, partial [Aminicella lysinilytica]|uniref:MBG domain-containing protein n=1 Tax=Aminicella lysinilytica TaxID=433323 RepID=UPI0014152684